MEDVASLLKIPLKNNKLNEIKETLEVITPIFNNKSEAKPNKKLDYNLIKQTNNHQQKNKSHDLTFGPNTPQRKVIL